jgi:Calcium-binding EGF domain
LEGKCNQPIKSSSDKIRNECCEKYYPTHSNERNIILRGFVEDDEKVDETLDDHLTDEIDISEEDEDDPHCYQEGDKEHCDCKEGFSYVKEGSKCVPILELVAPSDNDAAKCDVGFELSEQNICQDIDECLLEEDNECSFYEDCINTRGSFECKPKNCQQGFTLNINTGVCDDINECFSTPCGRIQTCVNHQGSYECRCMTGFRSDSADSKLCRDIDECLEHPGICDQNCFNTQGSFRCYCGRGYTLGKDNRTCVDIDECSSSSKNICPGNCRNIRGSYACKCPAGFKLGPDPHCLGTIVSVLLYCICCFEILTF